jgi:CheY-like chemotaxis protein
MSHEIRTPLNAIVGIAGFLKEKDRTKEQLNRYADIIEKGGKHLLNLINDIIDLSKLESGDIEVFYQQVDVHDLMNELYAMFNAQIKNLNKDIELRMQKTLWELSLWVDETRLNQIFINLLNNAIKFTNSGWIEFGYWIEDDKVRFYVEDSGIGISEDKLEIIFERFRQANETTEKNFGGTGLGLSIVKSSVELLGGTVLAQSIVNKGSAFSFWLPYTISSNYIKSKHEIYIENVQFNGETILLAEDEELSFQFLSELLIKNNLKVIRSRAGFETLSLALTNQNIKLVLLDIKMPEMDGWEIITHLKNKIPKLPVIAQTAYGLEDEIRKGIDLGFDAYITKPIDPKKLLSVIQQQLYFQRLT